MLKLKYFYSLGEILEITRTNIDYLGFANLLDAVQKLSNLDNNELEYSLESAGLSLELLHGFVLDDNVWKVDDRPLSQLMYLIKNRFYNHYIGECDTNETIPYLDKEVPYFLKSKDGIEFAMRFVGVIIATYPKYSKILNIYKDNENNLMSKLASSASREGSSSGESHRDDDYEVGASGMNLRNDTPQTVEVVATLEGNQFATEISKATSTTTNQGGTDEDHSEESSSSEEIEHDTKYAMEKIAEIQDSYQKVLHAWSGEFEGLFIEEENL